MAEVLGLALQALIPQLEKRRFSATVRPSRKPGRASENPRYVTAHVQRAVWERDGGQCTFVNDDGHRCDERRFIQLDHVHEVSRGGERCRAHNQLEAERTFGAEFMRHKRIAAAQRAQGRAGAATSP